MRQQWVSGRVIAIRPVAPHSETEKWVKQAYGDLVWVFRPHERLTTATRNFLARTWLRYRAWFFISRERAGSGAVSVIPPESDL